MSSERYKATVQSSKSQNQERAEAESSQEYADLSQFKASVQNTASMLAEEELQRNASFQNEDDKQQTQKQNTFLNSFSMAASKKQLNLNTTEVQGENMFSSHVETTKPQMPGFISEPNFEDDISIEVEGEEDDEPDLVRSQKNQIQPVQDFSEMKQKLKAGELSSQHPFSKSESSSRNELNPKPQTQTQTSTTSLGAASGLVGNVAKLKNSKLYQKFMQQKKDIIPTAQTTPSAGSGANAPGKIVKKPQATKQQAIPEFEDGDSLVFAVPPKKQPIHPEQPLVNQSLSYSLDMFIQQPQQRHQQLVPEIGESHQKPVSNVSIVVHQPTEQPSSKIKEKSPEKYKPVLRSPQTVSKIPQAPQNQNEQNLSSMQQSVLTEAVRETSDIKLEQQLQKSASPPPMVRESPYANIMYKQQDSQFMMYNNQTLNESNIELVAFSEQIMNQDHEIAPGIPTQDQVLKQRQQLKQFQQAQHYPDSTYVHLMQQQQPVGFILSNQIQTGFIQPTDANPTLQWQNNQPADPNESVHTMWPSHVRRQQSPQADKQKTMWPSQSRRQQSPQGREIAWPDRQNANQRSRVEELEQQLKELNLTYNKDKQFYEDALEVRMNQIEQLEQQLEQKTNNGEGENADVAQLRYDNKAAQHHIGELKRELQTQQANYKMSINENEQLRDEINLLQQRVHLEVSMQEQLKGQMQEMRDRLSQQEHQIMVGQNENSLLQTEVMALRNQIKQANEYLQSQIRNSAQFPSFVPPIPPVQSQNQRRQNNYYNSYDNNSDPDSAVPIVTSQKPNRAIDSYPKTINKTNLNQLEIIGGVQNDNRRTWLNPGDTQDIDESPIQFPSRTAKNQNSNIHFPSQQYNNAQEESQITFPSQSRGRQPQTNQNNGQRNLKQDMMAGGSTDIDEWPVRNTAKAEKQSMQLLQKQLQGSAVSQMMFHQESSNPIQNSASQMPTSTQRNQEHEKGSVRATQLHNIENNLLQLNLERDKYKDELSKIPTHAKKAEQIRRREHLESEVATLTRQIGTIKQKLREYNAI